MSNPIRIIGAIAESNVTITCISELLKSSTETLAHGGDFTGKPVTQIRASDTHVLKLHLGGGFQEEKIAMAWGEKNLIKNRETGLYHPQKTWFIIWDADEEVWRVGNVTPRMIPLHTLIEDYPTSQIIEWLLKVCHLYITHVSRHEERLDEGLSNFALADDDRIYYIDDDFYSWDHFLSFSAMIAGWFRLYSFTWLDEETAYSFALQLADIVRERFTETSDIAPVHVIYEHLGAQFLGGNALLCMDQFREALLHSSRNVYLQESEMLESSVPSPAIIEKKLSPAPDINELVSWMEEDEPVALLADIHANLPALDKVLELLDTKGIERIIALGDIVGYGPHPAECIERLSDRHAVCIRGNHDHMVGSGTPVSSMHGSRLEAANWTVSHLNDHYKQWLLELPLQWRHSPWIMVHGAPIDPTFFNAYIYERTAECNLNWMRENQFNFCIHGHSHLQGIYYLDQGDTKLIKGIHQGMLDASSLICPGSIGQPRGGTAGAEFGILRPKSRSIELLITDYDIEATIADMLQHQLPDQLMQRLRNGL